MPRILMCPPDHYGIEYEINPWMNLEVNADHQVATSQWQQLRGHLNAVGAHIEQVEPVKGLPDLVFTANAGLVYHRQVILSRFRYRQRRGEEPWFRNWFAEHGFEVLELPGEWSFEGAGDALFCGDTLFAGYRMRSDAAGMQAIGEMLGVRVIPVELVNSHYYHIDTCFCPIGPEEAIWFPGAFDEYGRRALEGAIPHLIEVAPEEATRFACNAVVVGRHVVTNTGCPRLHEALDLRGYTPIATPLDEFVKAGGSAKCLTLRLDGEEAATWKQET